jgi:hypothetical protein
MSDQATSRSVRARMKRRRSTEKVWQAIVFFAGLFFIVLGGVLVIFPGPLTIPPILLGLWIWATEFEPAERLLDRFQEKAKQGWEEVKEHPIRAGLITAAGIAGLVVFLVMGGPGWVTDKITGLF